MRMPGSALAYCTVSIPTAAFHVRHPQVGELRLLHEKFDIGRVGGMQLVVHHAEPGTDSVQSLALPGTLATSLDREESPTGEHATP